MPNHFRLGRVKHLGSPNVIAVKMCVDNMTHRQRGYFSEFLQRRTRRTHALGRVDHDRTLPRKDIKDVADRVAGRAIHTIRDTYQLGRTQGAYRPRFIRSQIVLQALSPLC